MTQITVTQDCDIQPAPEPREIHYPAGCVVLLAAGEVLQVRGVRCARWDTCRPCQEQLSRTAQHD